jgi:hypothetical protein
MSGIFISHASADKVLVDPFVESIIQLGCEVSKESIFYSSGEDTGVPSGSNLNEYVRSSMEKVDLVIAIISPTFQTRPFCIAELGAAWSRVGKLFPIATPGLQHADMQGVLGGLAVRYISDSSALDELHDLIRDLFNHNPGAKTWNRHKNRWLAGVDGYVQLLPKLRVITPADYDRALADLEGTRDALREADATIKAQEVKISRLATAKAEEVAEILLPDDERERFEMLVKQAREELKKLPHIVRDAMWYSINHREMPWPDSRSADFDDACDRGWLMEASSGEGVNPNDQFDEVRAVSETLQRLNRFLARGTSEAFDEWFRSEYHTPPDLTLKRVWDDIF